MSGVLLGAGIMLIGVVMGYALSNAGRTETEEVAKWVQEIEETENK